MVNNTAKAIVITNNGNLLVYFMLCGSRTKQSRYSTHLEYYFEESSILGVVHLGSPSEESMDWGSVFCPSPSRSPRQPQLCFCLRA